MEPASAPKPKRAFGRYLMYEAFAAGGMATVHMGRLLGPVGFSRIVAVKQLHGYLAADPDFVSMLLDEARLAARIRHPNVVQTLDVVSEQGELFVVLEYIAGESLDRLLRAGKERGEPPPPAVVASILFGALQGLHAAHEARDARGEPLELVHRDLSPQNLLVGSDGVARVLDFGVAKARGRAQTTREGQLKGKLAYMAPEQVHGQVTRRTDIFAASIVLWEALTGTRLFGGDHEGEVIDSVLNRPIPSPREHSPHVTPELEAVVMRGLQRAPEDRFATAREMALALESTGALATPLEVGTWVERMVGEVLATRAKLIAGIEASAGDAESEPAPPPASVPVAMAEVRHRFDSQTTDTAPVPGLAATELPAAEETVPDAPIALTRRTSKTGGRRTALIAVGAALAVATIAVAMLPSRAPAAAPVAEGAREPTAAMLSADPPANVPPSPTTTDVAGQATPDEERTEAPTPVKAGSRARSVPKTRQAACSPPYSVDAKGLRHYKPECL